MAAEIPILRLPHPYLTTYSIKYRLSQQHHLALAHQPANTPSPPQLHNDSISFTTPRSPTHDLNFLNDNTPWGRAQKALHTTISWTSDDAPTVGQIWLVAYVLFTVHHDDEIIRVKLEGLGADDLNASALATHLIQPYPLPLAGNDSATPGEVLLSRSAFWQGAGSPFGSRAVWVADPSTRLPTTPTIAEYTMTTLFPNTCVHARHPIRPLKPAPGSVVYSRWIPHLNEVFSMMALDWRNDAHLGAFHEWQNSPRVAEGWKQEGTLDEHRAYLQQLEQDPHVVTLLGRFNDELFAYYEVYWAAEDHLGAYYRSEDWDRGRHFLVGNERLRGPHRVRAWWSGLAHYCFLDDVRTQRVVGEPRESNKVVAQYDLDHGFWHECTVDLPHKRANLAMVSRERFFKMAVLHWGDPEDIDSLASKHAVK